MNAPSAPKKPNRNKQFALVASVSFLAAASSLFTKNWTDQLKFVLPMGAILTCGVLLVTLIPSMYLGYIRRKKAAGANVILHRILFCLYWFPFVPWAFLACIFLAFYLPGIIK